MVAQMTCHELREEGELKYGLCFLWLLLRRKADPLRMTLVGSLSGSEVSTEPTAFKKRLFCQSGSPWNAVLRRLRTALSLECLAEQMVWNVRTERPP